MSSPSSTDSWAEAAADALVASGVDLVCYLPDSIVSRVHEALGDRVRTVRLNREEEAIGICGGYRLAGKRCALLMQNTGFGNCINAILGLLTTMRIPALFVISMRGLLGEFNPAQVPVGLATKPLLDAAGIPWFEPERADAVAKTVSGAVALAEVGSQPVAILLSTQLTGGKTGAREGRVFG